MAKETLAELYPSAELELAAKLSDTDFAAKAQGVAASLPAGLWVHADKLIKDAIKSPSIKPKRVKFVAISHVHSVEAQDRRMKIELDSILDQHVTQRSVIANGESCSLVQAPQQIVETNREIIREGYACGASDQAYFQVQLALSSRLKGYDRAVSEYQRRNRQARVFGVDSFDGIVASISTYKEIDLDQIRDQRLTADISTFLMHEARTRAALASATSHLQKDDELIFIQGAQHHFGVEQWCIRNEVPYQPIIPGAVVKLAHDLRGPLAIKYLY